MRSFRILNPLCLSIVVERINHLFRKCVETEDLFKDLESQRPLILSENREKKTTYESFLKTKPKRGKQSNFCVTQQETNYRNCVNTYWMEIESGAIDPFYLWIRKLFLFICDSIIIFCSEWVWCAIVFYCEDRLKMSISFC